MNVRIGIIGGGFMGRRHADTIRRVPGTRLAAVADPYSSALADEYGVPSFSTHEALLDHGVDAVIIANPNSAHVATALDAHAAGVPALIEKPLAVSMEDLEPLLRAAESGSPLLVGHHRRHHPAIATAERLISSGALGELVTVNGMWATRKADAYFEPEWRRQPGAGVVLINAVHDLDLLRVLCGEIVGVHARTSSKRRGLPVPDTAAIDFETASGALGTYLCSDSAVSPWSWDFGTQDETAFPYNPASSCYFIAGTEGALTMPQLFLHRYDGAGDWNHALTMDQPAVDSGDSYTRQLEHFARVVRAEEAPRVTVADAGRTLALLDAVLRSGETGLPVQLA